MSVGARARGAGRRGDEDAETRRAGRIRGRCRTAISPQSLLLLLLLVAAREALREKRDVAEPRQGHGHLRGAVMDAPKLKDSADRLARPPPSHGDANEETESTERTGRERAAESEESVRRAWGEREESAVLASRALHRELAAFSVSWNRRARDSREKERGGSGCAAVRSSSSSGGSGGAARRTRAAIARGLRLQPRERAAGAAPAGPESPEINESRESPESRGCHRHRQRQQQRRHATRGRVEARVAAAAVMSAVSHAGGGGVHCSTLRPSPIKGHVVGGGL
ncbi:unnamed protein product [Lampetra planeri]